MTVKQQIIALVGRLCKKEGKTKEVSRGNMEEIVGLISDEISSDAEVLLAMVLNGERRAASVKLRAEASKTFLAKKAMKQKKGKKK